MSKGLVLSVLCGSKLLVVVCESVRGAGYIRKNK